MPGTRITVYDTLGRQIAEVLVDIKGTAALALPAGQPAGVYVVRAGNKALRLSME